LPVLFRRLLRLIVTTDDIIPITTEAITTDIGIMGITTSISIAGSTTDTAAGWSASVGAQDTIVIGKWIDSGSTLAILKSPPCYAAESRAGFSTARHPSRAIELDLINCSYHHARQIKGNMKTHTHLLIAALSVAIFASLAPVSFAQKGQAMSKAQAMAQQLSLTPQQKEKILPILAAEVPKLQHIRNDNSLSTVQKMQGVRAIHQQTDPQMKEILSPEQYQKLKQLRAQQIREATQGTMGH
jgi:Spy/CpxP family protein refolding chaperone